MQKLNVVLTFDTDDDLFDPSLIIDSKFNYAKPTFSSFVDNAEEIREIIENEFI